MYNLHCARHGATVATLKLICHLHDYDNVINYHVSIYLKFYNGCTQETDRHIHDVHACTYVAIQHTVT